MTEDTTSNTSLNMTSQADTHFKGQQNQNGKSSKIQTE